MLGDCLSSKSGVKLLCTCTLPVCRVRSAELAKIDALVASDLGV